nr:transglycosylase SLT domain-containing protein [Geoalkalibacter subterraneus]
MSGDVIKIVAKTIFTILLACAILCCNNAAAQEDPLGLAPTIWGQVSEKYGLDPYLLYSVALTESAKTWEDGLIRPWPWTLNVTGKGHYPATRKEAAQMLAQMSKKTKIIDVGMLQVNLHYHGHRVNHPEDLLDFTTNLQVAAQILKETLESSPHDLILGVGRYHSWRDHLARPYGIKVVSLAQTLRAQNY